ncbi:MAG TPA: winged helix-turn-helix domain-containing protein, partial [Kofleriaceae bacterium]|nr:winged helix-turn-helix domain-containing protein [Kofleriaceae bacterium]
MNFVDAAVQLLREADAPLHVEELCRLALERGLLDSPGANPLRSFKGRLTTELKRGDESRVVRVEDDLWTLSDAAREGAEVADAGEPDDEPEEVHAGEPEPFAVPMPHDAADDDGEEPDEEPAAATDEADEDEGDQPASTLTPEEAELASVYGDEVGTANGSGSPACT